MNGKQVVSTIYAVLQNPNNGYESDKRLISKMGFCIGQKFILRDASVGLFNTTIYLEGFSQGFNSVHFDLVDEEGSPVDIFHMPQFSTYTRL